MQDPEFYGLTAIERIEEKVNQLRKNIAQLLQSQQSLTKKLLEIEHAIHPNNPEKTRLK